MSDSDLLNLIRQKAEIDRASIADKAKLEAQSIVDEAAREAERLRSETIERVRAEADSVRERRYNSVRFRMNAKRYEIKAAAIEKIWRKVGDSIGSIIRSGEYKVILRDLFREGTALVPDGATVKVNSTDAVAVKNLIDSSARKLSIVTDDNVSGGLEFLWPDGKIVLKNTLYHRLSRLKDEGNAEIARLLFEEIQSP